MPFGVPNETKKQTQWLEKCVTSVRKSNPDYPESRTVAICKAQLKKNNWKVPESSDKAELSIRDELWELEKKIREAIDPVTPPVDTWVDDVFDDYVIIHKGDKLYQVDWSMSGDDVIIDWNTSVEVERKTVYEPVSEAERQIITEVPNVKQPFVTYKSKHRRITYGHTTIN